VRDDVTITAAPGFVKELCEALEVFRKGHRWAAGCAQLRALAKLGQNVLTGLGVPAAVQWQLFEPLQYIHGAVDDLERPISPELTRRLERSFDQIRRIRQGALAAVAMQLLVEQGKSEQCAAKTAGKQFGIEAAAVNNLRDQARRRRGSRKYEALQTAYRILLPDLNRSFPGDPVGAYDALLDVAARESGN
jgi:hypothetical protein